MWARHRLTIACVALLIAYAVILLNTAWLSDDAFITFRTLDNFAEGYGLRWNVAERVQSYTHPLWMLLLLPLRLASGEIYWTSLAVSALLSLTAVAWAVMGVARTRAVGLVMLLLILNSRAFVDYSTSGLENPLSYLLLVFFVWQLRSGAPSLLRLSLCTALLMLNRTDALLLAFPTLLWVFWGRRSWRAAGVVTLGFLPLVVWHVFAALYYGFPLPNTAYAKLATGISHAELLEQGFWYFVDSLRRDPVTLLTMGFGLFLAIRAGERRWQAIALGVGLHLAYLLWIGGDFMSGRFFTLPFLLCVLLVGILLELEPRRLLMAAAALLVLALVRPGSPARSGPGDYEGWEESDFANPHGIVDERGFYYRGSNPLLIEAGKPVPSHRWANWGRRIRRRNERNQTFGFVFTGEVGMKGFCAGPRVHIVDRYALTEPLLARLPVRGNYEWRIGHFERLLPEGYFETLETGRPQMADPELARYAGLLNLVTRAPIFDAQRLNTLARLNLGQYEHLLEKERERVRNAPPDIHIGIE